MLNYMTHPKHGKMPVYNPTEIAVNKKHGWVLEKIKIHPAQDDLIAKYVEKFGKKPHHKMKIETIRAKLDE